MSNFLLKIKLRKEWNGLSNEVLHEIVQNITENQTLENVSLDFSL